MFSFSKHSTLCGAKVPLGNVQSSTSWCAKIHLVMWPPDILEIFCLCVRGFSTNENATHAFCDKPFVHLFSSRCLSGLSACDTCLRLAFVWRSTYYSGTYHEKKDYKNKCWCGIYIHMPLTIGIKDPFRLVTLTFAC